MCFILAAFLLGGALLSQIQTNNLPVKVAEQRLPPSNTNFGEALPSQQLSNIVHQQNKHAGEPEPPANLPTSLLGSPLPQSLDIHADGTLVINKKILYLFDFYLSAMGEESIEVIVSRIKHNLTQQLYTPALEQCLNILAGYLEYRNEITVLKRQFNQESDQGYSLEKVSSARNLTIAARSKFLSNEVIEAFFEQADQYEDYMLKLVSIAENPQLSVQQKQTEKELLNSNSPQWLLDQQKKANQLNDYRRQYQKLQAQGANTYELTLLAEQEFSVEAADRLAELAKKREQWDQRLNQYRVELNTIVAMALESDQQRQEITRLRALYFTAQEIKRVNALDSNYLLNHVAGE